MTPKEKADELIAKYKEVVEGYPIDIGDNLEYIYPPHACVINAVLLAVNEIIEQWDYVDTYLADFGGKFSEYNLKFWLLVKKRIIEYQKQKQ